MQAKPELRRSVRAPADGWRPLAGRSGQAAHVSCKQLPSNTSPQAPENLTSHLSRAVLKIQIGISFQTAFVLA